jgi:hypothetical protein
MLYVRLFDGQLLHNHHHKAGDKIFPIQGYGPSPTKMAV